MSLRLHSIELNNFRNYESFFIPSFERIVILEGENAVGKTNLLEAIQLVCSGKSFRHPKNNYLVKDFFKSESCCDKSEGESEVIESSHDTNPGATLEGTLKGENRKIETKVVIGNQKQFFINNKKKKSQDFQVLCPSVSFTPDDLKMVKNSNSYRRDAVDDVGCQLSVNYNVIKKDFYTVLKNKNKLLKEGCSQPLLDAQNEVFIICSSQLTLYRIAAVERLNEYLKKIYSEITHSSDVLVCEYIPSWCKFGVGCASGFDKEKAREWLARTIDINKEREGVMKTSAAGAHKDEINFLLNGEDASVFASQGQQRSIVLAFKMAQVMLIEDILHTSPVLLLDDVMSELDSRRRASMMQFLKDDIQVFITTTNLDYFDSKTIENAQVIHIEVLK